MYVKKNIYGTMYACTIHVVENANLKINIWNKNIALTNRNITRHWLNLHAARTSYGE